MKITRNQFIRYLKEKNAYSSWLKNTKCHMRFGANREFFEDKFNFNINKFIDYYIDFGQPEEIIRVSFPWCYTEEGEAYWLEMYNELICISNGYKNIESCYKQSPSEEEAAKAEMV